MSAGKTDRILQVLIGLCVAALVYVVAGSLQEKVVVAGDRAPDFSIRTDSGRTVSNRDFGGRLLVLNFWATWCPPCVEEMPSLDQFQKQFNGSGVVVLGVSVDRSENAYRRFLERAGVGFLTARDPEASISAEYGTFKYPESYIINADGKVIQKIIGPTDWTDPVLVNQIKALL